MEIWGNLRGLHRGRARRCSASLRGPRSRRRHQMRRVEPRSQTRQRRGPRPRLPSPLPMWTSASCRVQRATESRAPPWDCLNAAKVLDPCTSRTLCYTPATTRLRTYAGRTIPRRRSSFRSSTRLRTVNALIDGCHRVAIVFGERKRRLSMSRRGMAGHSA